MRRLLVLAVVGAALLGPAQALAQNPKLTATVGPGFTIRVVDADGKAVTRLAPGTYEITVDDRSEEHNFHLQGPGVDERTSLEFVGTVSWTVTLAAGRYTFVCDPHADSMRGSFAVGDAVPTPPAVPRLVASIAPNGAVTLRDAAGRRVRALKARTYAIVVRDRSRTHNVHLSGAGVNRKTTLAGVATTTWRVRLRAGTLRFFSDAAPKTGGTARVR
jgi:plastocyanin